MSSKRLGAAAPNGATSAAPAKAPLLPTGCDWPAAVGVLIGFLMLYVPSYVMLAEKIWPSNEQGHGPIILAVSFYLLFAKRFELAEAAGKPASAAGLLLLLLGSALYVLGRSQFIMFFELLSQIIVLAGLVLYFLGWRALKVAWFPLFFMLFMVPLPGSLVASVTAPLKSAVSAVASNLLHAISYPVGRSGVVLTVGPYQLMVADACAGLNSMFTLEALGLLYMHLMKHTHAVRSTLLALLIIPISFVANIVRVMILVLVTYHFGDEAGQGFVHGFAGMVLFIAGLVLMLGTDHLLGLIFRQSAEAHT